MFQARWESHDSTQFRIAEGRSDYQGRAATLGLAHSFYDRRDSLGLVYSFSYRQVLAHRLRLVVAQQLRHGA
jgi:hypothetical protein